MNFPIVMLGPLFAVAGVAAIGLAVWVHLYQRSAKQKRSVSSMRLVPDTLRVPRGRKRIQNWPLFLLRALGVLLLGIAFARPGLPGGGGEPGLGREAIAFVLDRSGSMNLRSNGEQTAWEEGVAYLQKRLSRLHPQSRVRVFCYPPAKLEPDWVSPQSMKKQLAELTPTFAIGKPSIALEEAAEALARFRADMPETLEIVGDLQKEGWKGIETLTLPQELQIRIYQTGDPEAKNQSLALNVRGQGPLRRGAIVQKDVETAMRIKDTLGDEENSLEKEVNFSGEVLELPYRANSPGWVRRVASIEEAGDGIAQDNVVYDTFYVTPKVVVYLIEPHPQRESFLQKTFFLQQALRPTTGDGAHDSNFLPEVLPLSEASDVLNNYDSDNQAVVVIPALENWPESLPASVNSFYQRGNGVVFFAGPEITPQTYNSSWENLLPALPRSVVPVESARVLPYKGRLHPIWGGLGDVVRQRLRKLPLKLRFNMTIAEDSKILAKYDDGLPLFVVRSGSGNGVLFANTSIDRTWGDWPADGALFVPSMHRLVSQVISPVPLDLRNSTSTGIVGVPFDIKVDPSWSGQSLTIDGMAYTPDTAGTIKGVSLNRPGFFGITQPDGTTLRSIAVNFPPVESSRELMLPAILERQLLARRRVNEEGMDAATISIPPESGWWRWLLGALLIVWLCELLLASKNQNITSEPKIGQ